jgi:hypothetical protein
MRRILRSYLDTFRRILLSRFDKMKIVPNFTAAFGAISKNFIQQIIPSSSAYKSLEIGTITTTKTIFAARSKLRKGV